MSELRKEPITGRWVIIAPDGGPKPFGFDTVPAQSVTQALCPFCPGNEDKTPKEILAFHRHSHSGNPGGWTLRVIPNKFPVLRIEGVLQKEGDGIYDRMNGIGAHEVIIETPNHTETLSRLSLDRFEDVLLAFRERITDLQRDKRIQYVLIFKNHGFAAGANIEHSHSQLIALPIVPEKVIEEVEGSKKYYGYRDRCIYCDIVRQEIQVGTRVVEENAEFIALSPYASASPFETWILPKNHEPCFESGNGEQCKLLSRIFADILKKLDNGLSNPSYNFILHTSPLQVGSNNYYHWHFEIMPKLSRVVGFERGSGFYINTVAPEEAAKFLREVELFQ
jgi:UDPglucose--hexose-1-phosphate uridylyltransferase